MGRVCPDGRALTHNVRMPPSNTKFRIGENNILKYRITDM
jgi:hypothetical protein